MENGERACTYRACLDEEAGEAHEAQPQQRCLAGSMWRRDCNICRCTAAGEPACTRRACGPNRIDRVARAAQRSVHT